MSTEYYKRHRPKTLDDVVGNANVVQTLRSKLKKGTLDHCILLSGISGGGKTTLARIIRRELKCSIHDCFEMNIADVRGIDEIRKIRSQMNLAPMAGDTRMWILDECHQLTKDAQNAILKMLEDTPEHVYFVLATTDPQKLIPTVKNRALHLKMEPLTGDEMLSLLQRVAKKEGLSIAAETWAALVQSANGSSRAGLVALERVSVLSAKEQKAAIESFEAEEKEAIDLCRALIARKPWKEIAGILKNLKGEPESIRRAAFGYATSCLLNGTSQGYYVVKSFADPFYDPFTAKGLLIASCFEAIQDE